MSHLHIERWGSTVARGLRGAVAMFLTMACWLMAPAALVICLCFAGGSLLLYTHGNDFPHEFHPDESSKIGQVIVPDVPRNYRHPQLLLEGTQLAQRVVGLRPSQETAQIGRFVSACFASITVLALAMAGYCAAGLTGLLIAGFMFALCPMLVPYAHYMKEDTALTVGVALVVLFGRLAFQTRRLWLQLPLVAMLGAAAGVAVSGKYVGAIAIAPALLLAILVPHRRAILLIPSLALIGAGIHVATESRGVGIAIIAAGTTSAALLTIYRPWSFLLPARMVLFAAALVGTVAAINHRIFDNLDEFQKSMQSEVDHSITEHRDLTMDRPNSFFVQTVLEETDPLVLALAGAYVVLMPLTLRWRSLWDIVLVLFAGGFLAALSWSVIPFHRYALPVVVLVYLMGAMGAISVLQLGQSLATRWGWRWWPLGHGAIVGAALAAIVLTGGRRTLNYVRQFDADSRIRVRIWLASTLPAGSAVMVDHYTALMVEPDWRRGLPPHGMSTMGIWHGSLADARRAGIRYAVVADTSYERYFDSQTRPAPGETARFNRRRDLYRDLFDRGKLLWSSDEDGSLNMHAFTNPLIRVYELPR